MRGIRSFVAGHCHFSLLGQFGIAKLCYAAMAAGGER
jgi:hypothetical protein